MTKVYKTNTFCCGENEEEKEQMRGKYESLKAALQHVPLGFELMDGGILNFEKNGVKYILLFWQFEERQMDDGWTFGFLTKDDGKSGPLEGTVMETVQDIIEFMIR